MKNYLLLFFSMALFVLSCKKKDEVPPETRAFRMAVTPWPADFTPAEVDSAYNFINSNCDMVSHHFDEGIPYEEAFTQSAMPTALVQEVNTRKSRSDRKVFLSVSALGIDRISKANYYTNSILADTIKQRWQAMAFDDPRVVTAYVNYVNYLISSFNPIYVNFGVESNSENWNATSFAAYKTFLSSVYAQLKVSHNQLPLFISFMAIDHPTAVSNAQQLITATDYIGISAYPYGAYPFFTANGSNPDELPADFFTKYLDLAPSKPWGFAETGYIAEPLIIPNWGFSKNGTEGWQDKYLQNVLYLCNGRKAKFFIWFCHKDYDAGNITLQSLGLYQDLFALWEDTGLVAETGRKRSAYNTWRNWYVKPLR
ncbi:MAG: hypothetical protein WAT19_10750 [Ferruginibacter sp.]